MRDKDKTKAQLIEEMAQMRQRIADLEAALAKKRAPVEQRLGIVIVSFLFGILFAVLGKLGVAASLGVIGLVAIFGYRSAVQDYRRNQGSLNASIERKRSELKKHLGIICE